MTDPHSELRSVLRGRLITSADPDYDAERTIWKGVERSPLAIAQCQDIADIQRTIEHAHRDPAPFAVRGTGHDVAGRSMPEGGLVLSTAAMRHIAIDPEQQRAIVQPGVKWGELVAAASQYGLATPGASVATVGVAGFSLHGGFGWLMRRYGIACDNVLSLDLVTPDGVLRRVDPHNDPELFWAMRGAGANFGVVTSLTLNLHPVTGVIAGVIVYPADQARAVLLAYREVTAHAPDELLTHFYYMGNPDGSHSVGIGVCFIGSSDDAERALAPLDRLSQPWRGALRHMDPIGLQAVHDSSTPVGGKYFLRAHYLRELTDETIDILLDHCARVTAPLTKVFLEHLGGALTRVPADSTAFQGRDAQYSFLAIAGWTAPHETVDHVNWTKELGAAMSSVAMGGAYVNYLEDDENHRIPLAYGTGFSRLRQLKRKLDPTNLFRANRNIEPGLEDATTR